MKLTIFITNFLVLFSIILNSVLKAQYLKRPNIETIVKQKDSSNIQISLNNTSNQVSLIFEDKENLNYKAKKDADRFTLSKPENSTSPVFSNLAKLTLENIKEKFIANRRIFNTEAVSSQNEPQDESSFDSNLNDEIKNDAGLENQSNAKTSNFNYKKKISSNNHEKYKENTFYNKRESSFIETTNPITVPNQSQQKQQSTSHSQAKKIKYLEALKNIKKIKSRLNSFNSIKNGNNSNINLNSKDTNSASALNDTDLNITLNDLSTITETNIKDEILFEEFLKQKGSPRKKKIYDDEENNSTLFYNSISLIMLSMLGGGVVGIVFILYFTFKNDSCNSRYE